MSALQVEGTHISMHMEINREYYLKQIHQFNLKFQQSKCYIFIKKTHAIHWWNLIKIIKLKF